MTDIKTQTQQINSNVRPLAVLAILYNLKEFRKTVLIDGTARLLNELDQVISDVENKSLPLTEQKDNNITAILLGLIITLTIIVPWVFGVIDLIKILLK
jgi:hypothetical protein